eukprot:SAG22_NODE_26_length_29806_cov_19.885381_11_plen_191_part_00
MRVLLLALLCATSAEGFDENKDTSIAVELCRTVRGCTQCARAIRSESLRRLPPARSSPPDHPCRPPPPPLSDALSIALQYSKMSRLETRLFKSGVDFSEHTEAKPDFGEPVMELIVEHENTHGWFKTLEKCGENRRLVDLVAVDKKGFTAKVRDSAFAVHCPGTLRILLGVALLHPNTCAFRRTLCRRGG